MRWKSRRVIVSLVVLLLLMATSGSIRASGVAIGQPRTTDLISGGEDQSLLIVTPKTVRTNVMPPDKLWIPLFVTVPKGGKVKDLKEVTIEVGGRLTRLDASAVLEPQDIATSDLVKKLGENSEAPSVLTVLKRGKYMSIEVDVSGLSLKEGDMIPVTITARGSDGGQAFESAVTSTYVVMSLPSRTGWYAGDGHIHSAWSPDVVAVSIDGRASSAVTHGLKWIVITDHQDGIDDLWLTYVSQCNTAQTNRGIPVLPGLEVTALEADGGADALGYALSETNPNIPVNQAMTPQDLLTAINEHNPNISYPIIAHPYGSPDWDTWTATGFRGIELFSAEVATPNPSTVSKWFSLLRSGLAGTMSNGRFIVAMGSSDAHNLWGPGDMGMTWAYIPNYSSSNRTAVWDAIRAGRLSASGTGNLGCFALNDLPQGSIVNTTPGSSLTFKLVQQPETGFTCTQIVIYDTNQTAIQSFPNPSTETTWKTTAPSSDGFYIVKFVFDSYGTLYEVWANPIFVNVP